MSRNYKNDLRLREKVKGTERRRNLAKEILKDSTPLPLPLEYKDIDEAAPLLFKGNTAMVIYTMGSGGAMCLTKNSRAQAPSRRVKAVDTTGAGDGFIGSFLYQLWRDGVDVPALDGLTKEQMEEYITFSNRFCEYSVFGNGAIASYPTEEQLKQYVMENP